MKKLIKEIYKFRTFNRLKKVYRKNSVGNRNESSSEHSWSCMLLADFFLSKINFSLNKMKVYELLLYHDVLEIELGDIPLHPNSLKNPHKEEKEDSAINKLQSQLPCHLMKKYLRLFKEFKEQKTREAKFAKLIDSLDPIIHELDYKEDWAGWSKSFFVENKSIYFKEFPELLPVFNEILGYLVDNKYFSYEKEYLVKMREDKNLPKDKNLSFKDSFTGFTAPFMNDDNFDIYLKKIQVKRENEKALYIVKNAHQELYGGVLWNNPNVEMIANMDYMYCLPSWDWWINPQYPAKRYRVEYLNHTKGKYGNTIIFINNNKVNEEKIKKILENERFEIVDIKRQYEKNNIEFFMFYDYYRIFLPLKMARELNRINQNIKKIKPKRIFFLLRSGFLLSEFFKDKSIEKRIIDPNRFKENLNREYIIDDCIVMARSLQKIRLNTKDNFTLSILDSAMPKRIYEKEYKHAKIDGPEGLLNMFSCRIFEKNPFLIGLDIKEGKYVYYDSLVRQKFLKEIRRLQKLKNLNNLVNLMAIDLFNYRDGGYKNPYFESFKDAKQNEK